MKQGLVAWLLIAALLLPTTASARGGGGCLTADTLIATPAGQTEIWRLNAGDEILSPEGKTARIIAVYKTEAAGFIEIRTAKHAVNATAQHLIQTAPGSYEEADRIRIGDDIDTDQGPERVESIRAHEQQTTVYNLLAGGPNTYTANGIKVHNKGCFLPDTPILMADGTSKNISQTQEGDALLAYTPEGETLNTKVREIYTTTAEEYYIITTADRQVRVTAEHPFYIGDGQFKTTDALQPGDTIYVYGQGLLREQIVSKETVRENVTVYNLRTDYPNTYFADGIAVHNKGGGGGCFKAGTKVSTPDGLKDIESILPGDKVYAVAGDGQLKPVQVLKTFKTTDNVVRVTTGSRSVYTTAEHPFKTTDGSFKKVSQLKVGDEVATVDGYEGITAIEPLGEDIVYNLHVEEPSTYIADGFIVHNKGGSGGSSDPYRYALYCGTPLAMTMTNGTALVGRQCFNVKYYNTKGVQAGALQSCVTTTPYSWAACYNASLTMDSAQPMFQCTDQKQCDPLDTILFQGAAIPVKAYHPPGLLETCLPILVFVFIFVGFSRMSAATRGGGGEDLDFCYPRAKIEAKLIRTARVLDYLHHIDPFWDGKGMRTLALDAFTQLQTCWQTREYTPMQPLMMPNLYQQHLDQLKSMRLNHEIDLIADLKVHSVDIVNLRHYNKKNMQEFTAIIEAEARDYYVDDRTSKFLRGDTTKATFQEFWVFQRQDDEWLLREINQTRESDALRTESFVEDLTPDMLKNIYGDKAPAVDQKAPWLEEKMSQKGEKIHRMLNFLATTDKNWGEENMKETTRKAFVELLTGYESRDPIPLKPYLTEDMWKAYATQLERMTVENRTVEYRNLCVRKVDIVLVRNYQDNEKDEFTARVSAHAQKIDKTGGNTVRSDEYVTPFERYCTFLKVNGLWRLKETLPPAHAKPIIQAENVDEDASPEQVQWYYTKDRAL